MLHPQPGHAGTPHSPLADESGATDHQLPLDAADERVAPSPPEPDALQQARDLLAGGETFAAMANIRALIAREPKNLDARAMLAELIAQRGDLEGALAELGRAVEVVPDDVQILSARAAPPAHR
jgi:Flp pilus assembly protein TadD